VYPTHKHTHTHTRRGAKRVGGAKIIAYLLGQTTTIAHTITLTHTHTHAEPRTVTASSYLTRDVNGM